MSRARALIREAANATVTLHRQAFYHYSLVEAAVDRRKTKSWRAVYLPAPLIASLNMPARGSVSLIGAKRVVPLHCSARKEIESLINDCNMKHGKLNSIADLLRLASPSWTEPITKNLPT